MPQMRHIMNLKKLSMKMSAIFGGGTTNERNKQMKMISATEVPQMSKATEINSLLA